VRIGRTWSDDISRTLANQTEADVRRRIGGQRVYFLMVGRLSLLIDGKRHRPPTSIHTDVLFGSAT
jgi:hypothetical protein